VKGITTTGVLTDADALEAEVKRAMIAQSTRSTLLIDDSKLSVRGLSVIGAAAEVSEVLADGLTPEQVGALRSAGATVEVVDASEGAHGASSTG
jgi:DeoR/GlpR family transcriptional regulator of sugar metabolism